MNSKEVTPRPLPSAQEKVEETVRYLCEKLDQLIFNSKEGEDHVSMFLPWGFKFNSWFPQWNPVLKEVIDHYEEEGYTVSFGEDTYYDEEEHKHYTRPDITISWGSHPKKWLFF